MQKRAAERSPASSPAGAEAAGQLVLLAGDAVSLRPGGRAGSKQPRSLVYAPPMDHDPLESKGRTRTSRCNEYHVVQLSNINILLVFSRHVRGGCAYVEAPPVPP